MKNVLIIATALIVGSSFMTTAFAQEKSAVTAPGKAVTSKKPEKKAPEIKWVGVVVSVDSVAKSVLAKNKKGEMTFDVSTAKFAQYVTLEGLKTGEKIVVTYELKDGKNLATDVGKARMIIAKKAKQESTGEFIDDSVITAKIKAAILEEQSLKSLQINVKTYKGVAQLSGFVDSAQSAKKAGDIASSVTGIKEVKNGLSVK